MELEQIMISDWWWTAGVTGRQGMLTHPRHLIPPLVFPKVLVSMIFIMHCSIYLIWKLILTADFSVNMTGRTDFDCRCSVYVIWTCDIDYWFLHLKWGAQRVWPVDRGCLLLLDIWSHLIYSEVRVRVCPFSDLYFLHDLQDWLIFVIYAISWISKIVHTCTLYVCTIDVLEVYVMRELTFRLVEPLLNWM
jgi:hypothetical protein